MRILDRYILKSLIEPYLSSLAFSLFLLILGRMVQVAKYILQSSVTLKDIAELVFLTIPRLSTFAIPLATVLTVTVTLNRLASSGEIIAIEASGTPIKKLFKPFLIFTATNTVVSLVVTLTVLHHANTLFREKIYYVGKSSITAVFQEGVFIDSIPGFVFYFRKVSSPGLYVHGVYVEDFREDNANFTIVARKGQIDYDLKEGIITMALEDGTIAQTSKSDTGHFLSFNRYKLTLPADELFTELSRASSNKWEMNMKELWIESHNNSISLRDRNRYGIEFHQRIALPFLPMILGMLMLPVSAMKSIRKLSNKTLTVLIAFGLFLTFYMLTALGKGLSENGFIGPAVAVYTPVGIFCTALFYCWHRI